MPGDGGSEGGGGVDDARAPERHGLLPQEAREKVLALLLPRAGEAPERVIALFTNSLHTQQHAVSQQPCPRALRLL